MTDFISEIEKISSKQDFKENPGNWENNTLSLYLESISSWTNDMEGYYNNFNIDYSKLNQWQVFANILVASKVYE